MTESSAPCRVASITVTYNPELSVLEAQLRALPQEGMRIIVDNASRPELVAAVEALTAALPNARVIRNERNLGLAAAINRGIEAVAGVSPLPRFALLLDQDSEPMAGSVERLVAAFLELERDGHRVGCVGPALLDPATGLTHGFHQCSRWRWKRVHPPVDSGQPIACANLNGSGTLAPLALFAELGGLDEDLFIDHVDTEWSFRVAGAGYGLWGVPDAVFRHRMGQDSLRFWLFGWRIWPSRSPLRHYFLFRNAVRLMRRDYVPGIWKMWCVAKLLATFVVTMTIGPSRRQQACEMWRGVRSAASSDGRDHGRRAPGTRSRIPSREA